MTRTHARLTARLLAVVTALMLIAAAAAGCTTASPTQQPTAAPTAAPAATATAAPATTAAATEAAATTAPPADPLKPTYDASMYSDAITVDCYTDGGTYNGLQPDGWFAKAVQEKFNMKINLIGGQSAPGETVYQTRSAAGNLGDLIFTTNQHLSDAVKAGNLILDITDLYNTKITAYSSQFSPAEKNLQKYLNTDKVFGLPTVASTQPPTAPMTDGVNPQNGSYMRLDIYNQIGAPAMNSLDDLLPTLQKMVQAYPQTESGKKTYGLSIFKDWDGGGCPCCAGLIAMEYGWTRLNTGDVCFYNPKTGETQSFIDDNGLYKKTMELYFKANQMGLLDPDSPTQDWNTISSDKFGSGQIMFSWWSWLGIPGFNKPDTVASGKGYAYVPIKDQVLYNDGISPYGQGTAAAIGQGAKDPGRLADFLNWMSSPEGFMMMYDGPVGLAYTLDASNKPVLTDYGKVALAGGLAELPGPDVPAQYGGGQFSTGAPNGLPTMILKWRGAEMNPVLNCPYDSRMWDSTKASGGSALDSLWQKTFGADSVLDYLAKNNMIVVASPSGYSAPALSTDQNTAFQSISQEIVNESWKMWFAKDQAEFDSLWQTMVTNVKGLGFDDIYAFDKQEATDLFAAQKAFVDAYNASK